MDHDLQRLHLAGDELFEAIRVTIPDAVEALAADHLLPESFRYLGALLGPDQDENSVNTVQGEEEFFEEHFSEEASGSCDQHSLAAKALDDRHFNSL